MNIAKRKGRGDSQRIVVWMDDSRLRRSIDEKERRVGGSVVSLSGLKSHDSTLGGRTWVGERDRKSQCENE